MKLLEFHRKIIRDLSDEGGLLILGKGLGLERIICTFLQIHTNPRNLILLLNANDVEIQCLRKELETAAQFARSDTEFENLDIAHLKIVNNETPAKVRSSLYYEGGVVAITSRILVVDMLNHIIPTDMISGIFVNRAESVTDTSSVAFALRLFRANNKTGFIRAFSDSPDSFSGLMTLERALKVLQVRNVHLWPRFQMDIVKSIDQIGSVELVEFRIGLTKRMDEIQKALLDCISQSISELKRAHPSINSIDVSLENSLFRSFDYLIRKELEPVWHQISSKTKQIVEDLRTLRTLTHYLVSYDSVTFYSFLETIRAANALTRTTGFKQNLHSWLLLDSANVVFARAKERVFMTNKHQQPLIEEHPKWKALVGIIKEIELERRNTTRSFAGNVLIVTPEGNVASQIRTIVDKMESSSDYSCEGSKKILFGKLNNYYSWKDNIPKEMPKPTTTVPETNASKRRRVRAKPEPQEPVPIQEATLKEQILADHCKVFLEESESIQPITKTHIHVKTVSGEPNDLNWSLLDTIRPHWVIMYSPSTAFVRKLEVYKALNPDIQLKVYFMVYDNSIEEQQYLTLLRKEKAAFEKLVLQKGNISIPIDEQGNIVLDAENQFWEKVDSRIAGGQLLQVRSRKVLVDVREFRCPLPMAIHGRRMEVIPVTLEIGDYIISKDIAIERKAPSDLSQSLRSGRLYKQCQAMCAFYETPILLIEFSNTNAFRLSFSTFEAEMDVPRRLVLTILHFPKLGIIWSPSPTATAEVLEDLHDGSNPDVEIAQSLGTTTEPIDGDCNPTAAEMLLDVPGINFKNCHLVMSKIKNFRELSRLTMEECQNLIGEENGRKMYRFFNDVETLQSIQSKNAPVEL